MRVLHGLPERWVRACPALPFGLLQEAQALVQYVLCGVDASVVELTADVALHHVLRRQVLNRYEVIVPDKLGGQFMQHVLPLAGNVLLQPRHLDPCLLPMLTPLCLSGELTLEAGKFLLVLSKVFVVRIFQTIVL